MFFMILTKEISQEYLQIFVICKGSTDMDGQGETELRRCKGKANVDLHEAAKINSTIMQICWVQLCLSKV